MILDIDADQCYLKEMRKLIHYRIGIHQPQIEQALGKFGISSIQQDQFG